MKLYQAEPSAQYAGINKWHSRCVDVNRVPLALDRIIYNERGGGRINHVEAAVSSTRSIAELIVL